MVYLTNTEKVKSIVNIDDNINEKYLSTAIKEVQDIHLRDIFGDILLNKLIKLIEDEEIGSSGNTAYKALVDTAQYFISYQAAAQVILICSVKINNFGATQADDEHLHTLSLDETYKLIKDYQNKADYYKFILQNYLCEHRVELPEVTQYQIWKIHSNLYSAASSNIWLGGPRGKRVQSGRGRWWSYKYK